MQLIEKQNIVFLTTVVVLDSFNLLISYKMQWVVTYQVYLDLYPSGYIIGKVMQSFPFVYSYLDKEGCGKNLRCGFTSEEKF